MLASETGLAQGIERDYFSDIGVKPFINAAAAYSALGGRNMWPKVVEAMEYARERNVIMEELQDAVGKRLASLNKVRSRDGDRGSDVLHDASERAGSN